MGDLGSMRDVERDGRGACWRDHESGSGHVQADQGFGAHRMEKRRREGGGVPGQLLGTGGGAGMSTRGEACAWQKGQSKREEKRGQQDLKNLPWFLPSRSLQQETAKERAL
jgi:hypothetical protein